MAVVLPYRPTLRGVVGGAMQVGGGAGGAYHAGRAAYNYVSQAARYAAHEAVRTAAGNVGRRLGNTIVRPYSSTNSTRRAAVARKAKPYQALNSNVNSARRPYKKYARKRKYVPKLRKLARAVNELKREARADEGILTFRQRTTGRNLAAVNATSYSDQGILSVPFFESVLAQLRYYDPAAPSTLVTADGTTGTYQKDFYFSSVYAKLSIRNNYQVPVKVTVYNCKVKEDTNISPYTAMTNGLADVGAPTATSPLVYPSDSPQFRQLYKVVSTDKKVLQPGEEMVLGYSIKPFMYDPALYDSQALNYMAKYHCFGFLIRCEGVLGHDTANDEQGTLQSGIDWQIDRTVKVKYPAGANIEYKYVTDGSDAFTNGGVASSKPVSDNIPYSVS